MQSSNKRAMTSAERGHVARIKSMDCCVCGAHGPSDAHEIEQGLWWVSLPLCSSCHTGPQGWHGDKSHWRVRKLDELKVLNETLRKLLK